MPETASNGTLLKWDPSVLFSERAMRALDDHFDAMSAKRKVWRAERKLKTESALEDIIRLTLRAGFLRAHAISRLLNIHSGTVERALDVGLERGCIIRQQIPGAKRRYYEYSLTAGTRNYLQAGG
jgi:DNA-binding MarR family transcriptional regulator